MKLLFLDAYFYPENIAFSHIEQDIMEGLTTQGHQITVVCPTPSRGVSKEVSEKYRSVLSETLNGVEIIRFPAPREGKSPVLRAFRYFWCHFRARMTVRRLTDIDAVFAVSTPPTQGYFAGKAAQRLSVPLIYSLQDIFPDSLVSTGLSHEGSLLYRIGSVLEKKTYEKCTKIIVLNETARENLLKKGVEEQKLVTISNWIDTDQVRPVPKEENRLFEEYGIDRNRFNVVYAGNLSASQGAHVIVQTASLLKDNDRIHFTVFGAGTEYDKIESRIRKDKIENLSFFPLLPAKRISEVYSLGDVALITGKKGVGQTALPSKLFSIMACQTPVVASFDTDSRLADILRESGAGVCVEPEDPLILKQALEKAYQNSAKPDGENSGRQYIDLYASKKTCVNQYISCFEQAVSRKSAQT